MNRFLSFVMALISCLALLVNAVVIYADPLTADQQQALVEWPNWVANTCQNPSVTTGPSSLPGTWQWNSGLKPPYYLEEYLINILQDLAQAEKVSTNDTVTQEHIVALTAWAYAEGGNIANTGSFNIWNTGLTDHPELVDGATNASGIQSFKSFDAGVEANVLSITGSNKSRIGKILTNSSSTASQVLHTIAYYDETPGNVAWAWGNNPNDPSAVLQFNHTTYITSLNDQLKAVRSSYGHMAAVVIGPGEESTHYVNSSKLVYAGGSGANDGAGGSGGSTCQTGSSGSPDCTNAASTAKILCEAKKYNGIYYKLGGGHVSYDTFRQDCPIGSIATNAAQSTTSDPGPCATDCSGLVSVAVDQAFGQNYIWTVSATGTMTGSGAQNWQPIPMSSAQAGDIVTLNDHVEIVDHVSGNTVYTFGSHQTGTKTGSITTPISYWAFGAWHWTGPGS